jgi:hypothetical protein
VSTLNVNRIVDSSGGVLAPISSVHRNRIINGAMVIDQRNAGASVTQTTSVVYTLDRWLMFGSAASKFTVQQNAGSVTPPAGFTNYLGCTSTSAYSVGASELFQIQQGIEGFNTADLAFGTANAKTVTISFWVRSSLTGTFGGSLANSAADRSYPFTYTITAANTWEQKSVTIAGDTSGTWVGATNGIGLRVIFSLGAGASASGTANAWGGFFTAPTGATSVVGTSGATFYITVVQLEVGTQATSFEYRQYGTELALCQRYYWNVRGDIEPYVAFASGMVRSGGAAQIVYCKYPVNMRAIPTFTGANVTVETSGGQSNLGSPSGSYAGLSSARIDYSVAGQTAGSGVVLWLNGNTSASFFNASAEL